MSKKSKAKYKLGSNVLVYKGTKTFEDGDIVQLMDYDPHDDSYSVISLIDLGKKNSIQDVYQSAKWVKSSDFFLLRYDRPTFWSRFGNWVLGTLAGSLIGAGSFYSLFKLGII